ncbi:hypothetical protein HH214_00790 [Mucilaginibacter robiniae]|uniref:Uncharacterized protein n=1 Tax=Mucilaginibacter robiniae TaxID=2728022 RepID=A0A7L5DWQ1_9SPHI|nr:hypothetical protein [Mucilaginibacter robiniae]QJD94507.1 hypothetical protein HH214_00790 [Mucilaginibacter robiniae]
MKTLDTKTQILLKAIDLELKALLNQDIKNFRTAQFKKNSNNQGMSKQAA